MAAENDNAWPDVNDGQAWFTTAEAAVYLRTSVPALRTMVQRGRIRPDSPGRRGRFRGHRFSRATLDAFNRGESAA